MEKRKQWRHKSSPHPLILRRASQRTQGLDLCLAGWVLPTVECDSARRWRSVRAKGSRRYLEVAVAAARPSETIPWYEHWGPCDAGSRLSGRKSHVVHVEFTYRLTVRDFFSDDDEMKDTGAEKEVVEITDERDTASAAEETQIAAQG
ncbi:hypothetical protein AURDEDRAFT_131507 [Auricularia subglabra TFB-10046 SS5]|uniref:Uncharacterized protein n=1 Tax=Auricularia subglabra (strain TFB-10046 / SS5) TaxID=717982 RepID=J0WPJ3_AURST|nr:hypothetical protein AURDEDRAFT_131507 [Auricularia subglabra TFB-10046 SS5]